uniref:(northern house mosquito) hypothetical protein n=1 Tax=Culex pipiens TaxID=7175 RepID=A0A8D8HVP3_CULPI
MKGFVDKPRIIINKSLHFRKYFQRSRVLEALLRWLSPPVVQLPERNPAVSVLPAGPRPRAVHLLPGLPGGQRDDRSSPVQAGRTHPVDQSTAASLCPPRQGTAPVL